MNRAELGKETRQNLKLLLQKAPEEQGVGRRKEGRKNTAKSKRGKRGEEEGKTRLLTRVGAAISEYEHVYQRGGLRSVGHVERACVLALSSLPLLLLLSSSSSVCLQPTLSPFHSDPVLFSFIVSAHKLVSLLLSSSLFSSFATLLPPPSFLPSLSQFSYHNRVFVRSFVQSGARCPVLSLSLSLVGSRFSLFVSSGLRMQFVHSSSGCVVHRARRSLPLAAPWRSSLSVGHEGASIPRPSVLCTPRSLMGRVRSGQPEGKLIPRRSDGNAFLARPPPPPPPPPPGSRFSPLLSLSLFLSLYRSSRLQPLPSPCHASNLSLSLSFCLPLSRQQPLSSPCRASNFSSSLSFSPSCSRRSSPPISRKITGKTKENVERFAGYPRRMDTRRFTAFTGLPGSRRSKFSASDAIQLRIRGFWMGRFFFFFFFFFLKGE